MTLMQIESKFVFLDTNVLIYQTFEDFDEEKHKKTSNTLAYLKDRNYRFFISPQVLREYFAVATNERIFERPLELNEALSKIDEFRGLCDVLFENELSLDKLRELVSKYNISKKNVHDANIVATMLTNQVVELFTFNEKDFKFYSEIKLQG